MRIVTNRVNVNAFNNCATWDSQNVLEYVLLVWKQIWRVKGVQKLSRRDAQLCNSSAASVPEILMHREGHERHNVSADVTTDARPHAQLPVTAINSFQKSSSLPNVYSTLLVRERIWKPTELTGWNVNKIDLLENRDAISFWKLKIRMKRNCANSRNVYSIDQMKDRIKKYAKFFVIFVFRKE